MEQSYLTKRTPAQQYNEESIVITLNVPRSWGGMLHRLCRKEMRKRETEVAKSDFVPEPGKRNTNQVRADAMRAITAMIKEQLDIEP